ncbi:hypothetical protein SDC9_92314 [bioreactor metagenome]|uniref:Uncharacterized protein n=1 Tax=bioreactor metagenome TaxID=1076179 RepID=A0A644ZY42_9ZZZZ
MGEKSDRKKVDQITEEIILRALMENTSFSLYVKDSEGRVLHASKKMIHDLGLTDESELVGKNDVELFGEENGRLTYKDDLRVIKTGEKIAGKSECNINPAGKENWVSTTKLPLKDADGRIIGLIGISQEINELRRAEQELRRMATHDPLTALPNRALLQNRIQNAIESARLTQNRFAILFIDLDNFKAVNDRFGHSVGDQILMDIARVFEFSVRSSDVVSRYGGDEFVILLEGITSVEKVRAISETISENAVQYFIGLHIVAGVSIGASLYPEHGQDGETLIKAADKAMYAAKSAKMTFQLAETPK